MPRIFSSQIFTRSVFLLLLTVVCAECFAQTTAVKESVRALSRGDHQQAVELAEKHLLKYPNDAPARVILARAELAQGKFERAYQELQKALAADPRNIDALYYLAIVAK